MNCTWCAEWGSSELSCAYTPIRLGSEGLEDTEASTMCTFNHTVRTSEQYLTGLGLHACPIPQGQTRSQTAGGQRASRAAVVPTHSRY